MVKKFDCETIGWKCRHKRKYFHCKNAIDRFSVILLRWQLHWKLRLEMKSVIIIANQLCCVRGFRFGISYNHYIRGLHGNIWFMFLKTRCISEVVKWSYSLRNYAISAGCGMLAIEKPTTAVRTLREVTVLFWLHWINLINSNGLLKSKFHIGFDNLD